MKRKYYRCQHKNCNHLPPKRGKYCRKHLSLKRLIEDLEFPHFLVSDFAFEPNQSIDDFIFVDLENTLPDVFWRSTGNEMKEIVFKTKIGVFKNE